MPEIVIFPFYGPNRHSDRRLVECRLNFSADTEGNFPETPADVLEVLSQSGIISNVDSLSLPLTESRVEWYTSLFVQTVLNLQACNGHEVEFYRVSVDIGEKTGIGLVEYVSAETVMGAFKLTLEAFSGRRKLLESGHRQFTTFARQRVMATETSAIINAARNRGIEVLQLDEAPFDSPLRHRIVGHRQSFRLRPGGLLCLGQGVNRQVLDGTFCLDRSGDFLKALVRNPLQRQDLLRQLGIPLAGKKTTTMGQTDDRAGLLKLLVINSTVSAAVLSNDDRSEAMTDVPQSLQQQARQLSEKLGSPPLVMSYHVVPSGDDLNLSECRVLDFEPGPDLDALFLHCDSRHQLMTSAAEQIIGWLFPNPVASGIPTVAVTGTNGKTTTSRMLQHIFVSNGNNTGLVCTDGIFIGNEHIVKKDAGTFVGHAVALASKTLDAAVLETHHRGITVHGFAFNRCDVGVCLNVTPEHLSKGGIKTVEDMAVIKRAVVERASTAAVLFADNHHCINMLPHISSDYVCLVSLDSDISALGAHPVSSKRSYCVLENNQGEPWVVFYKEDERQLVMPVSDIPVAFDGTARFNLSNAMHAIAAAYFSNIEMRVIRSALGSFSPGLEKTPGRMNAFDGLPFRVIIDFAHNPDGVKNICEFADLQTVKGRKVIAFAGQTTRSDELNREVARTVAGHFDVYFCKDYDPAVETNKGYLGPFMRDVLVEEGVAPEATHVVTWGREVIFQILDSCQPGDLLILLLGHKEIKSVPAFIDHYRARLHRMV